MERLKNVSCIHINSKVEFSITSVFRDLKLCNGRVDKALVFEFWRFWLQRFLPLLMSLCSCCSKHQETLWKLATAEKKTKNCLYLLWPFHSRLATDCVPWLFLCLCSSYSSSPWALFSVLAVSLSHSCAHDTSGTFLGDFFIFFFKLILEMKIWHSNLTG